jgi:hypothetical protein
MHGAKVKIVTQYCCLLLSWKSWNWFEFRHNHAIIREYMPSLEPLRVKCIISLIVTVSVHTVAKTILYIDKISKFSDA